MTNKPYYQNRNIWYWVCCAIMVINLMRAIRFPTNWTYTQFLFNYDLGFCKRGLIGELVRQLNLPVLYTYDFFAAVNIFILIINLLLITSMFVGLTKHGQKIFILSAILYATSLAICMQANTVGYAEQIGLLITLVAIKIKTFRIKLLFIAISGPFLALVHEAVIVIYYPILIISLFFDIDEQKKPYALKLIVIYSIFLLALTFFVANSALNSAGITNMAHSISVKMGAQNSPQPQALDLLNRTIQDNLSTMQAIWGDAKWQLALLASFLVTFPTAIMLLYICNYLLTNNGIKTKLKNLSLIAACSPLLLHLLAWDFNRWNTLLITNSFILLYILQKKLKQVQLNSLNQLEPLFIFLFFLNGSSSLLLFGTSQVRQFPFFFGG